MNVSIFQSANSNPKTMSSREIAEVADKRHDHVVRDIRAMLEALEKDVPSFGAIYQDAYGRDQQEFRLPKDLTLTLVTGYDVKRRHAINVRWLELEAKEQSNIIQLPDFTNPALAARAWADQVEARLLAEATKAEIGSRREATAMNTASQATKKANKLEIELDKSMLYATVKRMEMLYHGQKFNWRVLKSTAQEMNIPTIPVFDQNYGTVKGYHADVWKEAYAVEIISNSIDQGEAA
jgi:hypothetical protein